MKNNSKEGANDDTNGHSTLHIALRTFCSQTVTRSKRSYLTFLEKSLSKNQHKEDRNTKRVEYNFENVFSFDVQKEAGKSESLTVSLNDNPKKHQKESLHSPEFTTPHTYMIIFRIKVQGK